MALVECSGGLKKPRFEVLKSEISSQIEIHRKYGGVVPGLAKREHLKNLPLIYKELIQEKDWQDIDAVAVTVGPGLEPALWTGIEFARQLAKEKKKPLLGANHLEGHLMSPLLSLKKKDKNPVLPAVGLVVSGGHTILLVLETMGSWKKIGETRDDAVGEAFDATIEKGFTRIPVFSGERENIVGYVILHDLRSAKAHSNPKALLSEFAKPISFVPEDEHCLNLLARFLKKRQHLAVVEDEYGGVAGIVTLEDLLETVLGTEIVDETDKVDDLQKLARKRKLDRSDSR